MDISGRTALVTGAGGGLGAVIGTELAARGARVLVADVDLSAAEDVARRIRGTPVELDAGGADPLAALPESPTILVNNAGGWGPAERAYPGARAMEWQEVLEVNLLGPMRLIAGLLEPMRAAGGGAVVNISSSAALGSGSYACPEYAVAKAGLIRLTTSLAGLAASHGVRVSCVVPGWIGLSRAVAELHAMSPAKRAAQPPLIAPEQIAGTVAELVGDDCAAGRVLIRRHGGAPWRPYPDLEPEPV